VIVGWAFAVFIALVDDHTGRLYNNTLDILLNTGAQTELVAKLLSAWLINTVNKNDEMANGRRRCCI
jgi:hypothetical protein